MISMDTQSTLKTQALAALSTVIDPELGVNIVDLDLIYDVAYDADLKLCTVTMTLTIMGCPLTGYLNDHIKSALMTVAGIDQVLINLVWEPAWSLDKMSRAAKMTLGLH